MEWLFWSKMVSFNVVDNFRKTLPNRFSTMKPESIYQNFVQGVQGKVQLKKNKIQVDIYGFQYRNVIAPLFKNLEKKLICQNVDPRCPWLNDHVLTFSFKWKSVYQIMVEKLLIFLKLWFLKRIGNCLWLPITAINDRFLRP